MFYQLLKWIVQFSLRIFYRRIDITGRHHIPAAGPLIVVSNHPNTLMDPLLVAAQLPQQLYFLTKSTYFTTPFRKRLLRWLHMVPVYRRQDQQETGQSTHQTAAANQQTFEQCVHFLKQGGTLLIFPEGSSVLERRLRDLKTGTARIALEALAAGLPEVPILPVGLNYAHATRFRSEVIINIGAPVPASEFAAANQPASQSVHALTQHIQGCLEDLLITTKDAEEDLLVRNIEHVYKDRLMDEMGMPGNRPEKAFGMSQGIVACLNYYKRYHPYLVRKLHLRIDNYVAALKRLRLQHQHLGSHKNSSQLLQVVSGLAFLVLGFPLFVYGALHNYLPYRLPGKAADALTEEEEFEAPIMLVTGMVTFPLWYAVCLVVVALLLQPPAIWLLVYALSLPVSGFFALFYRNAFLSQRGRWQLLSLTRKRSSLVQALQAERLQILAELEQIRVAYLALPEHPDQPGR